MASISTFPALDIKPAPNPLEQYASALSIKNMIGQGQEQQQAIQGGNIGLQMKNLALKNMQITQSAMSDPKLSDEYNQWQKSKGGSSTAATPDQDSSGGGNTGTV